MDCGTTWNGMKVTQAAGCMALVPALLMGGFIALSGGGRAAVAQTGAVLEQLRQIAVTAGRDEHDEAVRLARRLLESHPQEAEAYYLLGRSLFCLDRIPESVEAFDRYVQLRPERKNRQWERGIALYYAGKYAEGAQQFELYQTYHSGDVENAAWHFLCRAALVGPKKAQEKMLEVAGDERVPMAEIYALYRGEAGVERVWQAVEAGQPDQAQRSARLFYARLYIALYHHAWGRHDEELELLRRIDSENRNTAGISRYMWWVAQVHLKRHPPAGGDSPDPRP
ncbi:MAG: hypothetical protein KatS3mg110_1744 [Pirellulaceae bacterium]|nr:MAG: hypothetical protein KatS3mg110_1744 [Pirellulaceae bacterium]